MLDTEVKVDQFLELLKAEIMNGQMSAGEYGPDVRVEIKQDSGFNNNGDQAVFFNGTIRKLITVEIFPKPVVYTRLIVEEGEHSIKLKS